MKGAGAVSVSVGHAVVATRNFSYAAWTSIGLTFPAPVAAGQTITLTLTSAPGAAAGTAGYFAAASANADLEYTADDGQILHAIAEFIRIVDQDEYGAGSPKKLQQFYADAAAYYADILNHHFDTRWEGEWVEQTRGNRNIGFYIIPAAWSGAYANPNYPAGSSLPYNEYQSYGRFLLELYHIALIRGTQGAAQNAAYAMHVTRMAETLLGAVTPYGPGYVWDYSGKYVEPDSNRSLFIEDAAHANFDIAYVADLYNLASVYPGAGLNQFSAANVSAFTSTFENRLYDPATVTLLQYVNGTGANNGEYGHQYSNWPMLSPVDPRPLADVLALFDNHAVTTVGETMYPLTLANMALYGGSL